MADILLFLELPSEVVPVLLFLTREKIASLATRMLKRGFVLPWQIWSWDYNMRDWRTCGPFLHGDALNHSWAAVALQRDCTPLVAWPGDCNYRC